MTTKICKNSGTRFRTNGKRIFCSAECKYRYYNPPAPRCSECLSECALRTEKVYAPMECPKRKKNGAPAGEEMGASPADPKGQGPGIKLESRVIHADPDEILSFIIRGRRRPTWASSKPAYCYTSLCPDPKYRR